MHLRHIRPRSVDWYDATLEDEDRGFNRLGTEEETKLRRIGEPDAEQPVVAGPSAERPSRWFL